MTTTPATTSSHRDPAYHRALAFECAMRAADGLATAIPRGLLIADGANPLVWDVNTLWIDDADGVTADELVAEARRLQGPLGLAHRSVLVADEADWGRLTPGLEDAGYMLEVNVVMRHDGSPVPAPDVEVGHPEQAALETAVAAYIAGEPFGTDPEAARQVLTHVVRRPAGADERWFSVVRSGEVVAYARLWHADGVAQVEDVVVLPSWRRQGFGRAVVAAATRAGLGLDPELLFIVAADDDWPKDLYAELGYAPVGRLALFRQIPAVD